MTDNIKMDLQEKVSSINPAKGGLLQKQK